MDRLPVFELFPDPLREHVIEASNEPCGLCGKSRGAIYTGGRFSSNPNLDDLTLCPWCIGDGTAHAAGLIFNDATVYPCLPGSAQLSPEDRRLVEGFTPGFVSWQDHGWMMCCGRACIYRGEPGRGDLTGRWTSAIPSIIEDLKWSQADIDDMIAHLEKGTRESPCAYVFECRVCNRFKGFWDGP